MDILYNFPQMKTLGDLIKVHGRAEVGGDVPSNAVGREVRWAWGDDDGTDVVVFFAGPFAGLVVINEHEITTEATDTKWLRRRAEEIRGAVEDAKNPRWSMHDSDVSDIACAADLDLCPHCLRDGAHDYDEDGECSGEPDVVVLEDAWLTDDGSAAARYACLVAQRGGVTGAGVWEWVADAEPLAEAIARIAGSGHWSLDAEGPRWSMWTDGAGRYAACVGDDCGAQVQVFGVRSAPVENSAQLRLPLED